MRLIIKLSKHNNANSNNKDIINYNNQSSTNSNNTLVKGKRTCRTSQSTKL